MISRSIFCCYLFLFLAYLFIRICLPADPTHRAISSFWLESFFPHYHSIAILDPQTLSTIPLFNISNEATYETNFEFSKMARMQAALEFARHIWARHILVTLQNNCFEILL